MTRDKYQAIGINLAVEALHTVQLRYAVSLCQSALRGLGVLPLDNATYQDMIDVVQYVEGASEFCAGCLSAIDAYNKRKSLEQRRLEAVDQKFRIMDLVGIVGDAATQTEEGFDEALLHEIEKDIAASAPPVPVSLDGLEFQDADADADADAGADADADGAAIDVSYAKAFEAAADSSLAAADAR
jgi:hypothetical protein